ncbi:unnamed protein product [Plutella xylostella]|uniref:(diamondback moth) hypothetical protein n=1 Tax=Plutella xylostella TaxID=51655 RepID=A0A8S4ERI3_PLUXY|nr:unnamed protein product [Plutella xylostella]
MGSVTDELSQSQADDAPPGPPPPPPPPAPAAKPPGTGEMSTEL